MCIRSVRTALFKGGQVVVGWWWGGARNPPPSPPPPTHLVTTLTDWGRLRRPGRHPGKGAGGLSFCGCWYPKRSHQTSQNARHRSGLLPPAGPRAPGCVPRLRLSPHRVYFDFIVCMVLEGRMGWESTAGVHLRAWWVCALGGQLLHRHPLPHMTLLPARAARRAQPSWHKINFVLCTWCGGTRVLEARGAANALLLMQPVK
jgi:hypothetical protein